MREVLVLINRDDVVDPRRPAVKLAGPSSIYGLSTVTPVGNWESVAITQDFISGRDDSVSFWKAKVSLDEAGKLTKSEVVWVAAVRASPAGPGWHTNISRAQFSVEEIRTPADGESTAVIVFHRFTAGPQSSVVEQDPPNPLEQRQQEVADHVEENYGFIRIDALATKEMLAAKKETLSCFTRAEFESHIAQAHADGRERAREGDEAGGGVEPDDSDRRYASGYSTTSIYPSSGG